MNSIFTRGLGLGVILALGAVQAEVAQETWVARYNGPGSGKDNAQALTVDAVGNAYVTGFSDSGGGNYDFATVKYDGKGNPLWVARYDGESQGSDWVKALAIDTEGNVLVTGSSAGQGTGFDFATVKYDAEGKQLWISRYDGPAQGDDRVKALVVDAVGNVYVTGDSAGQDDQYESVIIKYSPNGDQLWAIRSDSLKSRRSLAAIATDAYGNVFVVGTGIRELGNTDFLTIKYDSKGNEIWTAYGDWSTNDNARFLALDAAGNVYVTGTSLRYTEDPEKIGHKDITSVKYSSDGRELWSASFNGGGETDDVASALRVDLEGHVYVVGTSYGSLANNTGDTSADYITIKYNVDGQRLWLAPYQGPGGTEDTAYAATIDKAGGVYILGSERGGPDRKPWLVTIKYAPDGSGQWVARHEGMATDGTAALAVDGAENLWTIGIDASGQDYLTIKYAQSEMTTEVGETDKR